MLHAVIMAGGAGSRFWPESREARPKQLLRLLGQQSMIRATVDRLAALVPPERMLVVTTRASGPRPLPTNCPSCHRSACWPSLAAATRPAALGWRPIEIAGTRS